MKYCKACRHSLTDRVKGNEIVICGRKRDISRRIFGLVVKQDLEPCEGMSFELHPATPESEREPFL